MPNALESPESDGQEVPGQIAQRANVVEPECQKGSRDEIVREPLILWPDGLSEASIVVRCDKATIGNNTFQGKAMDMGCRRQIGNSYQWMGDDDLSAWSDPQLGPNYWVVSASWSASTIYVATSHRPGVIDAMAKISKSGVTDRE